MLAWEVLSTTVAPDGQPLELRRRGHEYLIRAGGYELMSNQDDSSSRALSELGCAPFVAQKQARILIGGLGMGYTLRAALDAMPKDAVIEVAELIEAVAEWNRGILGDLAKRPLEDRRSKLVMGDVRERIREASLYYHAILLDVDNGPTALAHKGNNALYSARGIERAWNALLPGGMLGVWSISDDNAFTARLKRQGFEVKLERVHGSRKGRGRLHVIWLARKPHRK